MQMFEHVLVRAKMCRGVFVVLLALVTLKFKNICLIEKGFDLNYLNNFSKVFSFYENNLLLPQNDLRYYILKFPFNNVIKRKIFNSPFILIKKQKFLNKFTYCNYLLFNNNKYYLKTLPLDIPEAQRNTQGGHKHKVCLKKIVSKNDGLKRNYFNFNNKKRYTFYDFFSLKGYYCFKNIYTKIKKFTHFRYFSNVDP